MVVYPAPYKQGPRDDGAWRWLAAAGSRAPLCKRQSNNPSLKRPGMPVAPE